MIPAPIAAFFAKYGIALVAVAIAAAAIFFAGKFHERAAWESKTVEAVEAARGTERDGSAIANSADAQYLALTQQHLEEANAELFKLREQLASVPDCRVPVAVVRLSDGTGVPATARPAGKPETKTAPVAADAGHRDPTESETATVECRAVIENCAVNRVTVCEPNALQLQGVQDFYEALRKRYNQQP